MTSAESCKDSAGVRSPAQTVSDPSIIDLGDGTAVLQVDIEAPWSAVLQILRTIKTPAIAETEGMRLGAGLSGGQAAGKTMDWRMASPA